MYKDTVLKPKRGFAKDKNFKCLSFKKVKIKPKPISSPDCSGNPFLLAELVEAIKKIVTKSRTESERKQKTGCF